MPGADAGPIIPVSSNDYLPYCSVSWPGGAALVLPPGPGYDPCAQALAMHPCATIQRAGLYSSQGENSVLELCRTPVQTHVQKYRGLGSVPMQKAIMDALAHPDVSASCVFTVAPAELPVFSLPYGLTPDAGDPDPSADVQSSGFQVFNFDYFSQPVNVGEFGQMPYPPGTQACAVDRKGAELSYCASSPCTPTSGCQKVGSRKAGASYQWTTTNGKPVLAVAPGVVVMAWNRVVTKVCMTQALQPEVYVEHRVQTTDSSIDAGTYEERFVVGYRGLAELDVQTGDMVARGQLLGKTGKAGCITDSTFQLFTLRETNLTGARAYTFATLENTWWGFNGPQGLIDPFGWGAPEGVDPWAWLFIGCTDACVAAPGVTDTGAFSINLFLPGQAPPHE
jgi:hypothetical protein